MTQSRFTVSTLWHPLTGHVQDRISQFEVLNTTNRSRPSEESQKMRDYFSSHDSSRYQPFSYAPLTESSTTVTSKVSGQQENLHHMSAWFYVNVTEKNSSTIEGLLARELWAYGNVVYLMYEFIYRVYSPTASLPFSCEIAVFQRKFDTF